MYSKILHSNSIPTTYVLYPTVLGLHSFLHLCRVTHHQHPPARTLSLILTSCSVGWYCQLRNMKHAHCFNADWNFKGAFRTAFLMAPSLPSSIKTEKIVILKIWTLAHFILLSSLSVG